MPITGSQQAPLVARLKVKRLGATRLGYAQPVLRVTINGIVRTNHIRVAGFSIRDELDGTPNTATLRVDGPAPSKGHEIKIYLGDTWPAHVLFAGHILEVTQVYDLIPAHLAYDLSCISYEWLLNRRKVTARYRSVSATAIATDLLTRFTSGFSGAGIQSGLPSLDEITFTNEDVIDCLDRLAKRIGGRWIVDYSKVLHFGLQLNIGESPIHPITATATHGLIGMAIASDLSQVKTRILIEGGGAPAAAELLPGAPMLPVLDAAWYAVSGGTVMAGPQRITYTGVLLGGPGALVGAVPTPTNAPTLTAALGAGLGSGVYGYAITFTDSTGETLPGPTVVLTLGGQLAAPTTAPVLTAQTAAPGLSNGTYAYAVTFTDATGETLPGPYAIITISTKIAAPTVAAVPAKLLGGNLSAGIYQWACTYVNAAGQETDAGTSASVPISMDSVAPPSNIGTASVAPGGSSVLDPSATYRYKSTFRSGTVETLPGPASNTVTTNPTGGSINVTRSGNPAPPAGFDRQFYRTEGGGSTYKRLQGPSDGFTGDDANTYFDVEADVMLGANAPSSSTAVYRSALVTIPVSPDPTVTKRRVYRTAANGSTWQFVGEVTNNTATTFSDNVSDAGRGALLPLTNTTGKERTALTAIPIGPTGTVGRKVYRTPVNGSQLKLLTTLADNTTTTHTDSAADSALGANVPTTTTTTTTNQTTLTSIPLGPSGTTNRKVYRTTVNGSALLLLTTIAGNSVTTYTDSAPDAALGAPAPTTNTSGLVAASGTLNAGSTVVPVTASGPFPASGAWVHAGGLAFRYTGKTATSLTGVPASGNGALVSTLNYGTEITVLPALTGIPTSGPGAIQWTIARGDEINLFVMREDVAAQVVMAGLEGGDGIHEDFIQDRRLSRVECEDRGDARLLEVKDPIVRVQYETRDQTTRSGRDVTITLSAPAVSGTFRIQRVTMTDFDPLMKTPPVRQVEASSRRFSLEALLRLIKGT